MLITNVTSPVHRLARHVIRNTQGMLSNRVITPFIATRAMKNVPSDLLRVCIEPQLIPPRERLLLGGHFRPITLPAASTADRYFRARDVRSLRHFCASYKVHLIDSTTIKRSTEFSLLGLEWQWRDRAAAES